MIGKEIDVDIIKIAKELGAKRVIIEDSKISIEFEETVQAAPIQLPQTESTFLIPIQPNPKIEPGQIVMYTCPTPDDSPRRY